MKTKLFLTLIAFACLSSMQAELIVQFEKTYGGAGNDHAQVVKQTADGGYIMLGNTNSFGAGSWDILLLKTNANGDSLWSKTFGGANADQMSGNSLEITSDGGYIITGITRSFGNTAGDVYLIKTDADGNTLWEKTFGGAGSDFGLSVKQTPDGGYVIAGATYSFGVVANAAYLARTDADGNLLWQRVYDILRWEGAIDVSLSPDGGYVVTGVTIPYPNTGRRFLFLKTDPVGDVLWINKSIIGAGYSILPTPDGGYIAVGDNESSGTIDVQVVKIDGDGNTLWTKLYGGSNAEWGYDIQPTSDGGYIIAAETWSYGAGAADVYMIRINAMGDTLWTKTYGYAGVEYAFSALQTMDGGYVAVGFTRSIGAGNNDFYLLKFIDVQQPGYITGKVFIDNNESCNYEAEVDAPFNNRMLKAEPGPYYVFSDREGNYEFKVPPGEYTVSNAPVNNDLWHASSCVEDTVYTVNVVAEETTPDIKFPLTTENLGNCVVSVDITSIPLEQGNCTGGAQLVSPCPNTTNQYCFTVTNAGPVDIVTGATLHITLNNRFVINDASLTSTCNCTITSDISPFDKIITFNDPINKTQSCEICIEAFLLDPASPPYTAEALFSTAGSAPVELIVNGDFEAGNTGFTSSYNYVCIPNSGSPGLYCVGTNPTILNSQHLQNDHTSGAGKFLIADGSPVLDANVWCQNINVVPEIEYNLFAWVNNIMKTQYHLVDPILEFTIDGVPIPFCPSVTLPEVPDIWVNINCSWTAPPATTVITLCARSRTNASLGNDFGLDDISFFAKACAGNIYDELTEMESCSCDPNDKLVGPKGCGPYGNISKGQELTYRINFENIGTGRAHNIVIKDTLDNDFDLSTLKILHTSHSYTRLEIQPDNVLVIFFEGIELPGINDSLNNKGFVIFKITPQYNLPDGTAITNSAAIVFDSNLPVITNTTLNTIRDNPYPVAAFAFERQCNTIDNLYNFTYTGGTADNATFVWDFGTNAVPATSTGANPNNVLFTAAGTYYVSLTVERFGCTDVITDSVVVTDAVCGKNKVQICHIPPGNTGNPQIICISESALAAHLAHGDCIGLCNSKVSAKWDNAEKELTKQSYLNVSPNPFNDKTNISFLLNDDSYVILKVYNYLGMLVKTVYDSYAMGEKEYKIEISTDKLPQGIYFGVMQTTQGERIVKQLIINK